MGRKAEKLTPRQLKFIDEYMIDLNATQAAIRAGYAKRSAHVMGVKTLEIPYVKAALKAAMAKQSARTHITADQVVKELAKVALSDIKDFVTIKDGNVQANSLDALQEGKSRVIKKLRARRAVRFGSDGERIPEIEYEYELYDKIKSLELLARHLGILNDKKEISFGAGTIEKILAVLPPALAESVRQKLLET